MEAVRVALVGCGGIAGAHVRALKSLRERDVVAIQVVATCDVEEERAHERAKELGEFQGVTPNVYTALEEMLEKEGDRVEAVDICSLHSEHHRLAVPSLQAGKHVIVEKPLGITMRAGRLIMNAALQSQRILAVAENYRRSPQERAVNRAIRQGRIGRPRTFFWQGVSENLGKWGWRNFKLAAGGGWMLDGGVHFTDLFRYHLGSQAQSVFAVTRQYEPYRYDHPDERKGAWNVDVEDAAMALISFDDDVVVQWTWAGSAPGQGFDKRVIYGSEGCVDWETGLWTRAGERTPMKELTREYRASLSEEEGEKLFPGGMADTFCIELKDFADAIREGTVPEIDGMEGFKAQAICMAVFESGWHQRPVSLQEIERCELEGYQAEVNEALGI